MRPETRTLEYVVLSEADIQALLNKSITDTQINDVIATNTTLSREAVHFPVSHKPGW
jgi:hypothetical protein